MVSVGFVICVIKTKQNDMIFLILIQASFLMVGVRIFMLVCP